MMPPTETQFSAESQTRLQEYLALQWYTTKTTAEHKRLDTSSMDRTLALWLGVQDETITSRSFIPYSKDIYAQFGDPASAFTKGREFIHRVHGTRTKPMSGFEQEVLTTRLTLANIFRGDKLIKHNNFNNPFHVNVNIGNIYGGTNIFLPWARWIADSPKMIDQHHWGRDEEGVDQYPRGLDMSLSDEIQALINTQGRINVLDIGMGTGYLLDQWKSKFGDSIHTTGVTVEPREYINNLVEEVWYGPAEILPMDWSNRFDLVVCNNTIRYLIDPIRAIGEALRVTKPQRRGHLSLEHFSGFFPFDLDPLLLRVSQINSTEYSQYCIDKCQRLERPYDEILQEGCRLSQSDAQVVDGTHFSFLKIHESQM